MVSNELVLGALLALNVVLYASLVFAALRLRRRKFSASSLSDAFKGLELASRRPSLTSPQASRGRRRSRA